MTFAGVGVGDRVRCRGRLVFIIVVSFEELLYRVTLESEFFFFHGFCVLPLLVVHVI